MGYCTSRFETQHIFELLDKHIFDLKLNGKMQKIILVLLTGFELGSRDLGSDTLPIKPPHLLSISGKWIPFPDCAAVFYSTSGGQIVLEELAITFSCDLYTV